MRLITVCSVLATSLIACSSPRLGDDGGARDATAAQDAAAVDARAVDVGLSDAGTIADGQTDVGVADAGSGDATGAPDALGPDAAAADATPADAAVPRDATFDDATPNDATSGDATGSDAAPTDATPVDTGPSDAGFGVVLEAAPPQLDFGAVTVGSEVEQSVVIRSIGDATAAISEVISDHASFEALPPYSSELEPGESTSYVVRFSPAAVGPVSSTLRVVHAAGELTVALIAEGLADPGQPQLRAVPPIVDFGDVTVGDSSERAVSIENHGNGQALINTATVAGSGFVVTTALPIRIAPGEARAVGVRFAPAAAGEVAETLQLVEAGGPIVEVRLSGVAAPPRQFEPLTPPTQITLPATANNAANQITATTSAAVSLRIGLPPTAQLGDAIVLTLRDTSGTATTARFTVMALTGTVAVSVDASTLADGGVHFEAHLERGAGAQILRSEPRVLDVVKSTSGLPPPDVAPLPQMTAVDLVTVTGTAAAGAWIRVDGAANTVEQQLGPTETNFELQVVLRRNAQNWLVVCAEVGVDTACAVPISVVHLVPDDFVVAEATSRRLTTEEIEGLVASGVIDVDDPENYHVSEFTVMIQVGEAQVPVSQPVAVRTSGPGGAPAPGVYYGGGGSGGSGGGYGGGGGGSGSSARVFVVQPPGGLPPIPGVIVIDGRIRTLREFFQVTLALSNFSSVFQLESVTATLELPPGLTAIRGAVGTDVSTVEVSGPIDEVDIGTITTGTATAAATGAAQFVVRGDVAGVHDVSVAFGGVVTGPGLGAPHPFSGSAATSVSVYGPPRLDVRLSHPATVTLGEVYDLGVAIRNVSPVPAHYASIDLRIDHGARLATDGCAAPPSLVHFDLGHLSPGETQSRVVQLVSCLQGAVIGCSVQADQNLSVSVATGTSCATGGDPVPFDLPAPLRPPVVVGSVPSPNAVVSGGFDELQATLTTRVTNVTADQIDNGSLTRQGTVFLERMSATGRSVVARVAATATTIYDALADRSVISLTPAALQPDTVYRATIAGGADGVRNAGSGLPLAGDYVWFFRTEAVDNGLPPSVVSTTPAAGATSVAAGSSVQVTFSERIDPRSLSLNLGDYHSGAVALVSAGTVAGQDVTGGTPLGGTLTLSADGKTIAFRPDPPIFAGGSFTLRLAGVRDPFGSQMVGVHLTGFASGPPDMVAPVAALVDPVRRFVGSSWTAVTGLAEPYAAVSVSGGAATGSGRANASGRFSVATPLLANTDQTLSVVVTDLSGNVGPSINTDVAGGALLVGRDATPPTAVITAPAGGTTVVGVVDVSYTTNDAFGPGVDLVRLTVDGFTVAEARTPAGVLSFDSERLDNADYALHVWARDAVGWWASTPTPTIVTVANPLFPRVDAAAPAVVEVGSTERLRLTGANLPSVSAVRFDDMAVTSPTFFPSGFDLIVDVTVPWDRAPGPVTLIVENSFGTSSIALDVVAPSPTISGASPSRLLASATARTIVLSGAGFLSASEVVFDGAARPTTVLGDRNLSFELPAGSTERGGSVAFSVRTADPLVGYRWSVEQTVTVVIPALSFTEAAVTVVYQDVRSLTVLMSEVAETGGYDVAVTALDPDGTVMLDAGMLTIPAGMQTALIGFTALATGTPALITASAPFAISGDVVVAVIDPPQPSFALETVVVQPRLTASVDLLLDRPAPTDGAAVDLEVFGGGATVAASVQLAASEDALAIMLDGVFPGDFTLSATTAHGRTATVAVHVRQAVASSAPAIIRASALGNEVLVRIATDGVQDLQAAQIEVPPGWSTPDLATTTAVLGDGTDVSGQLTRGAPSAGPSGGTVIDLDLTAPVRPSDASPWVDVLFSAVVAHEVLGWSSWPVQVDSGNGLVPVFGEVELLVQGTAADGAGVVALSTLPTPLAATATGAAVVVSLTNDVELITDASTIFNNWTQYGDNLRWGLQNHATFGQIMITPVNGDPGYFISDDALANGTIELEIGSLTTSDDDFIGLVFRWQDSCNFYLLDWKKGSQNNGGQQANEGMTLRRVTGCDHDGNGAADGMGRLWGNVGRPNILGTFHNGTAGWVANRFHVLRVEFDGPNIAVLVDDVPRISVSDPAGFSDGRYGPYSYSQAQTAIRNLRVTRSAAVIDTVEVEVPSSWVVGAPYVLVGAVDRTADLVVGAAGTGAGGGTPITLSGAAIQPEVEYQLTFGLSPVPAAGSYAIGVRTAGAAGELMPVVSQPTLTVVP